MATATEMCRDLLHLSSQKSLRAATIKTRFADIIVKAKCRKLIEESGCNKADASVMIKREKLLLERKLREEKAKIKARALRSKIRQRERLALEKVEEEARANFDDHLATEREIVNLCGGSRLARTRWWAREFGLVLRTDYDEYDDDCLEGSARDDLEEGQREFMIIPLFLNTEFTAFRLVLIVLKLRCWF